MKKITLGLILILILFILTSCGKFDYGQVGNLETIENVGTGQEVYDNDEIPITRIEVAKMVSLTLLTEEEINNLEPKYIYEDVDYTNPDAKYVTAISNINIMAGDGISFRPTEYLTILEAEYLLNAINENNEFSLYINDENKDVNISYGLWTDLYYKTLLILKGDETLYSKFGLTEDNVIVLETSKTSDEVIENTTITDSGVLNTSAMDLTGYINKEIRILKKSDEVIAVLNIVNDTPTIEGALITENTSEYIKVFVGGVEKTYKIINGVTEDFKGKICDITINHNVAKHITVYTNELFDVPKSYTDKYIEFENNGVLQKVEGYKLYYFDGMDMEEKYFNDLVVGSENTKHIINDQNQVIASIIYEKEKGDKIRVAINTTDFNSLVHNTVDISATTDYKVTIDDVETIYTKDEHFILDDTNKEDYLNHRIYIEPIEEEGKIIINSITRNYGDGSSPKYRGVIEIAYINNGFTIINELTMDEYLYSVIPSEMPVSYGLEALKVQAITARSYAYNQIFSNRFHKYGGNVDDSVSSQVYNNIEEQSLSNQAVDETSGMYLAYGDDVVSANFYSTSSGNTANSGDVWANTTTGEFPVYTPEYLTSRKVYEGDYIDLTIEENADKFFRDETVESYDSFSPWFRWNVYMTKEDIINSVNTNINTRYNVNKNMIEVINNDGTEFVDDKIIINDILDINILSRGDGGIITAIELVCDDKTIIIKGEYNIRYIIAPKQFSQERSDIQLVRKDGSTLSNYSLMPSAFYTIDKEYDNNGLLGVTFYGGGNGHGVGMSQNGVKGMADAGYNYEEILKYYYKDVEVIKED